MLPVSPTPFLLRVAAAWPLPGLGLLALPAGPTPYLTSLPLHTALPVRAQLPDGTQHPGHATVEEVNTENAAAPVRGLLLDLGATSTLPAGTIIELAAPQANNE